MRIKGLYVVRSGAPVARAQADPVEPDGDEDATGAEPTDDTDEPQRMDVRFSPFGTWYEINSYFEGQFLERTAVGSFNRTISQAKRDDGNYSIKSMFNHGMDFQIGDKLLGTVTEAGERNGSGFLGVDLYRDASYVRDLMDGLRAGDYGSSFMFEVLNDSWEYEPGTSDYNPDGLPERTITEVRLLEAGPVTWPANPAATAGLRAGCLTDSMVERQIRRDKSLERDTLARFDAFRAANRLPGRLAPAPEAPKAPARHVVEVEEYRAQFNLDIEVVWQKRLEITK